MMDDDDDDADDDGCDDMILLIYCSKVVGAQRGSVLNCYRILQNRPKLIQDAATRAQIDTRHWKTDPIFFLSRRDEFVAVSLAPIAHSSAPLRPSSAAGAPFFFFFPFLL